MTREQMILLLLSAGLVQFHHLMGSDVSWCRTLSVKSRVLWTNGVGILLACVISRLAGSEWLQAGFQTALVMAVPWLMQLVSWIGGSDKTPEILNPNDVLKKSSKVLMVLAVLMMLGGCAGSLQDARLSNVAGIPMRAQADPSRCESLDRQYVVWGGVSASGAVLSGTAGLVSIPVQDEGAKAGLVAGAVLASAVAAGSLFVSEAAAKSWARECQ